MKLNPKLNQNFKSPMKSQIDDDFIPDVNISQNVSPEKLLKFLRPPSMHHKILQKTIKDLP